MLVLHSPTVISGQSHLYLAQLDRDLISIQGHDVSTVEGRITSGVQGRITSDVQGHITSGVQDHDTSIVQGRDTITVQDCTVLGMRKQPLISSHRPVEEVRKKWAHLCASSTGALSADEVSVVLQWMEGSTVSCAVVCDLVLDGSGSGNDCVDLEGWNGVCVCVCVCVSVCVCVCVCV